MSVQKNPMPRSSCLLVGKDRRGRWVVRNERGTSGGLFIDRAAALRFAMLEIGNDPRAVIVVPGTLELGIAYRDAARMRNQTGSTARAINPSWRSDSRFPAR